MVKVVLEATTKGMGFYSLLRRCGHVRIQTRTVAMMIAKAKVKAVAANLS